ncbi:hypothetical protein HRQ91_00525 [Treponema parvum]|uniref:DUF2281 domain-containing protein n=1 Tax=Treponema parvum TaxID=138851 RepID=A0A975F2A4_9SPIR|nr:hypothetical protein [Treponema parvum]QTQ13058.1 hypothetical protein HRQ91_00525 [Treponema parvum]
MNYEAVLEQLRSVPVEYLDEISDIISYVMYKHEKEEKNPSSQLADAMTEALQISGDSSVKAYSDTKELFEELNS